MPTLSFHLMLAFLIAHELDAVRRHEWRLLPWVRLLPEDTGRTLFLWSHVPLALLVFQLVVAGADTIGSLISSGFAILHAGLHWLFRDDPANEFEGVASVGFILLAGIFGAVHMTLSLL